MASLRDASEFGETVAKLRRRRVTFEEIAAHIGVTQEQAAELYRQALETLPEFQAGELRAEELLLADDAIRRLMTIAMAEHTSPRTAVEAWNSLRGWSEHKAKLLGLDSAKITPAPAQSKLHALREARTHRA